MIQRYPHIAVVKTVTEVDNGTSIPTTETTTKDVKGRFEPTGRNSNLNYTAKYYCSLVEVDGIIAGSSLEYLGISYKVAQPFIYQTHAEIWLD